MSALALLLTLLLACGAAEAASAGPLRTLDPAAAAPLTRAAEQQVVLAQDDGLMLVGKLSALRGKAAPELDAVDEAAADAQAPLPNGNVFFRGAACRWSWRFRSAVTLTFTLPKAIFSGRKLPVYRYADHAWRRQEHKAVVGKVNSTASTTITRPGTYALLLNRDWRVVSQDGNAFVLYTGGIPRTVLRDPQVAASGAVDDPAVIAAVMAATGSDEQTAQGTLRSYDSSTRTPVRVLTLKYDATIVRNWSGASTVGRWFAPADGEPLPSPKTACRIYALPADNTAVNATLHLVKPRAVLITGLCSDMTTEPGYGPWATGGGPQLFAPQASTYPPPAYDSKVTTILCELRWEKTALDDLDW
ncbi:MAG: hypothetical protein IMZ74_14820 [Actinobacteria bacterium]|nr:hypothetical protein [Actinomycetota bacterium]